MSKSDGSGYFHGNAHYLDLVRQSRENQIVVARETKDRITKMFIKTSKRLSDKAKKAGDKSLTRRFALDYKSEITEILDEMGKEQFNITVQGIRKSAQNGTYIEQALFGIINDQNNLNLSKAFRDTFARVPENALNEILSGKMYTDGAGLSKRIWKSNKGFKNDISYMIEEALIAKKSAIELASDLEKYVNESARTDKDWSGVYKSLSSKKCSYEAQRVALTSISHAYQLSTIRSASDNPYIEGVEWLISNSHRETCDWCKEQAETDKYGLGKGIFPKDKVPLDHPNGLCTLAPFIAKSFTEIGSELRSWVSGGGNRALDNWLKDYKGIAIPRKDGIIEPRSGDNMIDRAVNGMRRSAFNTLTDEEIEYLKSEVSAIQADLNVFKFNFGRQTSYIDDFDIINVRGDVFPDTNSTHPRDILSPRAVLAHEYYGHRKNRFTTLPYGSWNDEFRASYFASKYAPNLSEADRRTLLLDAIERAKEAGVSIKINNFMRRLLYGY